MLLIDFITNIVSDVFNDFLKDKKQKIQLQEKIQSYIERHKNENGLYSINSEYDYTGLYEFCKECLLSEIVDYIKSTGDNREKLKKEIKQKAINASNVRHNVAATQISKYIEDLLKIVYTMYRDSADVGLLLVTGELEEKLEEKEEHIISEIKNINIAKQIQHDTFTEAEIDDIILKRKEWALNQVIFPWFHDSKKYREVFPELFVKPVFCKNKKHISYDSFIASNIACVAILGDAGAGKSTILKYIFAFSELKNTKSIYFTAKEIIASFDYLQLLNSYYIDPKHPIVVMIDGIDEAFYNNYNDFEKFIISLKAFNHLIFWLGCRTDFYRTYFNEHLSFIEENYLIEPWKDEQIKYFITKYSAICNGTNISAIIEQLTGYTTDLQEIKKNPFQLALLVYLAENNEDEPILGVYNLYERFLQKWIQNEKKRGTSPNEPIEIINCLKEAAKSIYDGEEWKLDKIAINNSAVKNLLACKEKGASLEQYATNFYHMSLATFLLAESFFETIKNRNCLEIKKLLSYKLKDDVTNFIGDKFTHMTVSEKNVLYQNMKYAYDHIPYSNSTLSVHEQIIYFVTRLDIDVSDFLLRVINNKTQSNNSIMRLTLAYGCVLSENDKVRDFAIKFARSIENESIDACVNRGWTVCYFGDVNDRNPYTYLDDEQRSWTKARNARIKRFTKKQPRKKDVRFWLFDIPLFYSFLNSRGWNDISEDEYKVLKNISISSEYFNKSEIEFLSKALEKLLQEYFNHLQNQCN